MTSNCLTKYGAQKKMKSSWQMKNEPKVQGKKMIIQE